MWTIPKLEVGNQVELIEDVQIKNNTITLEKGSIYKVTDVGTRYGLPFISPEGITHEIQLQPKTYQKVIPA